MKALFLFYAVTVCCLSVAAQSSIVYSEPAKPLGPCAFHLTPVLVLAEQPKPEPSLDEYDGVSPAVAAIYIAPATRLACPYERAVARYGDENVRFVSDRDSRRVEVCNVDSKTICTVVFVEPPKKKAR